MTRFVRVRDNATGHHLSLSEGVLVSAPERFSPLKSDGVDIHGRPLPPKLRQPKTSPAPAEVEAAEATNTEANKEATK